jgi:hypothetical protein
MTIEAVEYAVSVFMRIIFLILILIISGCENTEEKMISNTAEIITALNMLKQENKFSEGITFFYPGAPNEEIRLEAESILNDAISKLMDQPSSMFSENSFWAILEVAAIKYSNMDSEEIDRALTYMEDIMDIYGIESSEGRLNEWRYGFNPN